MKTLYRTIWFSLVVASTVVGLAAEPGITPEEIEADWFHQDEARTRPPQTPPGQRTTVPEEDALGGVDGVKTGRWGFHTENELDPWWQVDLGKPTSVDRIVLYNRCDSCRSRIERLIVLLSLDGQDYKQAFQNNGKVFGGQPDKKPLVVKLDGRRTRFVRLLQPGKNWFHLDEVEIYSPGSPANLARGKPATQSSTSQWSYKSRPIAVGQAASRGTDTVIRRGLKLAESLGRLEAPIDAETATLRRASGELKQLPPDASEEQKRRLYLQARWTVRKMTLANPLFDFDSVLFVKRAAPMFPHMSDQFYGWWSRPGGSICILEGFKGDSPRVKCFTADWDDGTFLRPDLSFDGKKVLFAYCKYYPEVADLPNKVDKNNLPEDAFFHIYEMNLDGSGVRRLTRGKYDDFDARYLPNDDIVFVSTRKGQALQCGAASAGATDGTMLPDSYVRCGGGDARPVPVFTIHRMNGDGGNLCAISAFENFEWTPSVAADGRIVYARWDYIDRFNGPFMSLWSMNPDGTNPQLVYGNYTKKPQCVFEAQSVPNSTKLIFTACAHHSNLGGSLALLDRPYGSEGQRPLTRLTPEVPFPETEAWADTYYVNPLALSEEYYLVSWSDKRLPGHSRFTRNDPRNPPNAMGLYLYDAFGNLEPLYRDPDISATNPIPVRPRRRPPVVPDGVDWDARQEGRFLLQDVYRGLDGAARGSIRTIRVIGVPPKVQPYMNNPVLGVSREDPGKIVLGTAPVEEDGSAHFRVPSGMSVFFQALDHEGLAVQTMRSLTYVHPNRTLSCAGCHESRDSAPSTGAIPLAAAREPSSLAPGPEGSWPLRYDRLVQPVLDRLCVECHRPGADDAKAAAFDLTADKSYESLISYADKDLYNLAFERDRSIAGEMPARKSQLLALLRKGEGHQGVNLDADDLDRLATWMDTYVHRIGHFSDEQEAELRELRRKLTSVRSK